MNVVLSRNALDLDLFEQSDTDQENERKKCKLYCRIFTLILLAIAIYGLIIMYGVWNEFKKNLFLRSSNNACIVPQNWKIHCSYFLIIFLVVAGTILIKRQNLRKQPPSHDKNHEIKYRFIDFDL